MHKNLKKCKFYNVIIIFYLLVVKHLGRMGIKVMLIELSQESIGAMIAVTRIYHHKRHIRPHIHI